MAEYHFFGLFFQISLILHLLIFVLIANSEAGSATGALDFLVLQLVALLHQQLLLMPLIQEINILINPIVDAPERVYAVPCRLELFHFCKKVRFEFKEDVALLMNISFMAKAQIKLSIERINVGVQKIVDALVLSFSFYVLILLLNTFHFIFNDNIFTTLQAHAVH